jgi:hypothetical protein
VPGTVCLGRPSPLLLNAAVPEIQLLHRSWFAALRDLTTVQKADELGLSRGLNMCRDKQASLGRRGWMEVSSEPDHILVP